MLKVKQRFVNDNLMDYFFRRGYTLPFERLMGFRQHENPAYDPVTDLLSVSQPMGAISCSSDIIINVLFRRMSRNAKS